MRYNDNGNTDDINSNEDGGDDVCDLGDGDNDNDKDINTKYDSKDNDDDDNNKHL